MRSHNDGQESDLPMFHDLRRIENKGLGRYCLDLLRHDFINLHAIASLVTYDCPSEEMKQADGLVS
jgi:hypothetical protein